MFSTAQGERTAVGVKAHVLFGRLLKDDLVWELLHAESVGEIAERLRRAPGYQAHLETLPPRDVHRYDLEALLKTIPLTEAAAFLNYLNGPRDAFLRAWVERHEADNLKSLLRWILSGRQDREELRRRLWMVPASPLSYDLLLSARDFPEFLEALRGTRYFPVIREPMKRLVEGEGNLFSLEMALDIHAEARIHQALLDLEPEDRRPLMPLFGGRFDLLNLYWLYRGKRFYRMTPEELMNRLLPCRYRIGFPLFRRMARAQTLEEALEALSHTPYVRVFHESAPPGRTGGGAGHQAIPSPGRPGDLPGGASGVPHRHELLHAPGAGGGGPDHHHRGRPLRLRPPSRRGVPGPADPLRR